MGLCFENVHHTCESSTKANKKTVYFSLSVFEKYILDLIYVDLISFALICKKSGE